MFKKDLVSNNEKVAPNFSLVAPHNKKYELRE